jgi:hypothetical protein
MYKGVPTSVRGPVLNWLGVERLHHAEVEQRARSVALDEHVVGLDVAMHHACLVHQRERD